MAGIVGHLKWKIDKYYITLLEHAINQTRKSEKKPIIGCDKDGN